MGTPDHKAAEYCAEPDYQLHARGGGVVLDPFMGSGTTAVACIRTGRNYIGFELNTEYYEVCKKRILNEDYNLFK